MRLTTDPGEDEHPTVAAGMVVFTSYRAGNGELFAMPAAGGPETRLTTTAANEIQPALSPDGLRLAYASDVSGVPKLWMSAADGTGAARLTGSFGFAGSIEGSPSWAPSGDRLVFMSTVNGSADLFILVIDPMRGGQPALLVGDSSADVEPAWSPDGTRVAFASNRSPGGTTNIYTVAVATGAVTPLTTGPGPDGQPGWLPDGRLVYVFFAGGTPRLRWLDPAAPDSVHDVALGPGATQHPAADVP